MNTQNRAGTLGELKASGYRSRSVKAELRENLVRFDGLPLVTRVASLPALDPGTRVRLDIGAIDLMERAVACVYRETLGQASVTEDTPEPGVNA